MEIELTVTRGDKEIVLRITGTIDGGSPAITSGPPDAWEPGVDPDVEITEISWVQVGRGCYSERYRTRLPWLGELTEKEEELACKELLQEAKDEANEQLGNVAADRAEERDRYDDYLD